MRTLPFRQDLLADYTIASALETTLGANQWASDAGRLEWTTADDEERDDASRRRSVNTGSSGKLAVELKPMQIRTFVIRVTPN